MLLAIPIELRQQYRKRSSDIGLRYRYGAEASPQAVLRSAAGPQQRLRDQGRFLLAR